jgi:hypothetical protein
LTETTIVADYFSTGSARGRLCENAGRKILVASNIYDQEVVEWLARI